jgi:hypothetical protein
VRGKDVLTSAEREELARLRRRLRQLEQESELPAVFAFQGSMVSIET